MRMYRQQDEARCFLRWLDRKDPEELTGESVADFFRRLDVHPRRLSRTLLARAFWQGDVLPDGEVDPDPWLDELADIVLDVPPPDPDDLC